jgi:hypothetical protein
MKQLEIIDTAGQWTPIINGSYSKMTQANLGKRLLATYPKAGQVSFCNQKNQVRMMGGELSINGSIASGFYLFRKRKINSFTLLTDQKLINVLYGVANDLSTVEFDGDTLVKNISGNKVILQGISYALIKQKPQSKILSPNLLQIIDELSRCSPAAGIIFYAGNAIWPVVFVKATTSYSWGTACGSASLAYFLVSGKSVIVQPSNQVIKINRTKTAYAISTKATALKLY